MDETKPSESADAAIPGLKFNNDLMNGSGAEEKNESGDIGNVEAQRQLEPTVTSDISDSSTPSTTCEKPGGQNLTQTTEGKSSQTENNSGLVQSTPDSRAEKQDESGDTGHVEAQRQLAPTVTSDTSDISDSSTPSTTCEKPGGQNLTHITEGKSSQTENNTDSVQSPPDSRAEEQDESGDKGNVEAQRQLEPTVTSDISDSSTPSTTCEKPGRQNLTQTTEGKSSQTENKSSSVQSPPDARSEVKDDSNDSGQGQLESTVKSVLPATAAPKSSISIEKPEEQNPLYTSEEKSSLTENVSDSVISPADTGSKGTDEPCVSDKEQLKSTVTSKLSSNATLKSNTSGEKPKEQSPTKTTENKPSLTATSTDSMQSSADVGQFKSGRRKQSPSYKELQQKNEDLEMERKRRDAVHEKLTVANQNLRRKIDEQGEQLQKQKKRNDDLIKQVRRMESEKIQFDNKYEELKNDKLQLDGERNMLQEKADALSEEKKNMLRTLETNKLKLLQVVERKEEEIRMLEKDKIKINTDYQKIVKELDAEIRQLQSEKRTSEERRKELDKKTRDTAQKLTDCENSLQEFARANQYLSTQVGGLQEQIRTKDARIETLEAACAKIEAEKKDLLMRLSKMAGEKLTEANPAIADLSDVYRPTKLAEMFSEVYDNEWTDAFEEQSDRTDEEDAILFILNILHKAYDICKCITREQQEDLLRVASTLKIGFPGQTLVAHIKTQTENVQYDSTTQTETSSGQVAHIKTQTENFQYDSTTQTETSSGQNEPNKKTETSEPKDEIMAEQTTEALRTQNNTTEFPADQAEKREEEKTPDGVFLNSVNEPTKETDTSEAKDYVKEEQTTDALSTQKEKPHDTNSTLTTNVGSESEASATPGQAEDQEFMHKKADTNTFPEENVDQTVSKVAKELSEDGKEVRSNDNGEEETGEEGPSGNKSDDDHSQEENDMHNDFGEGNGTPDETSMTDITGGNSSSTITAPGKVENEDVADSAQGGTSVDPKTTTMDTTGAGASPRIDGVYDNGDEKGSEEEGTSVDPKTVKIDTTGSDSQKTTDLNQDKDVVETQPEGTPVDPQEVKDNERDPDDDEITTCGENQTKDIITTEVKEVTKKLDDKELKALKEIQKATAFVLSEDVEKTVTEILKVHLRLDEKALPNTVAYLRKCVFLCWKMVLHDPPLYVEHVAADDNDPNLHERYRAYTKTGNKLQYLVWPALFLHKDGAVLNKGVAQFTNI